MPNLAEVARCCNAAMQGGDPERHIAACASLGDAGPAEVAFLSDPRYLPLLAQSRAAGVFVRKDGPLPQPPAGTALLLSADPEMAFLQALDLLHPAVPETSGIDARACVEPGAVLGPDVHVGPCAIVRSGATVGAGSRILGGAYLGRGCQVGQRCCIHPRAVLYDGVVLGDDCVVHAGAVIGADGFGYKFRGGKHIKVPQVGVVRIGSQVEIGANACIDRAALGETVIGDGTKIDNLVQIGHNVKLGKHVILCGQAGIAGSVTMDDYAVLGANAGVADHVKIGMAARVGAKSGVMENLPPKAEVFGLPSDERRAYWRQLAALRRLPEMVKRLRELEQQVADLKQQSGA